MLHRLFTRNTPLIRNTSYVLLNALYVLLLAAVLACAGGQHHAHAGPHAVAEAQAEVAGAPAVLEAPASPDHCHEPGSGPGSAAQSSARLLPLTLGVTRASEAVRASVHRTRRAAPRALPGGGRTALNSLCRWRI
ncbi:hypothetical protein ACH4D5_29350 [Streptomyces sp. NPDC018029]|uniref:hypothetical protein n=1 Tax=Streptomyces sp. NPDC018029 TaxID=3365032 RepID=UPI00378BDF73